MLWTGILIKHSIVSKVSILLKGNKAVRKLKMKIYADRTRTCLSFIVTFKACNHSVQGYLNDCLHYQELLIGITMALTILSVSRIVWDESFQKWENSQWYLCLASDYGVGHRVWDPKITAINKMEESHEQVLTLYEVEFVHQIVLTQIFFIFCFTMGTLELFIPIRRHIY